MSQKQAANGSDTEPIKKQLTFSTAVKRAISRSQEKWDKDDLLDVLFWWRQILSIVAGVIWGILPLTGLYGFLLFFMGTASFTIMFYRSWLRVDEEEYGGMMELAFEGMAGAMPLFLLVWTISYSSVQF